MQVNLSDSEWKLMNRLWEQSPRTIMELTAAALNPAFGSAADLGTGWALLLGAAACGVGLVLFLHGMRRLN